jgi:hypothetical protein
VLDHGKREVHDVSPAAFAAGHEDAATSAAATAYRPELNLTSTISWSLTSPHRRHAALRARPAGAAWQAHARTWGRREDIALRRGDGGGGVVLAVRRHRHNRTGAPVPPTRALDPAVRRHGPAPPGSLSSRGRRCMGTVACRTRLRGQLPWPPSRTRKVVRGQANHEHVAICVFHR